MEFILYSGVHYKVTNMTKAAADKFECMLVHCRRRGTLDKCSIVQHNEGWDFIVPFSAIRMAKRKGKIVYDAKEYYI